MPSDLNKFFLAKTILVIGFNCHKSPEMALSVKDG
jgi:hypothetical protein